MKTAVKAVDRDTFLGRDYYNVYEIIRASNQGMATKHHQNHPDQAVQTSVPASDTRKSNKIRGK
jgi:hypothetical protein